MSDLIDSASLLDAAEAHGYATTSRSLELWRYRGLLPRGERQPKGRAVWLYPPETKRQLLRLLHWRTKTRSLDLIRVALWAEGFAIERDGVRRSLVSVVDFFTLEIAQELSAGNNDVSATIEALARKLAGKRGVGGLPRVARMTAEERRRACAFALAYAFKADEEIARRKQDAPLFERMLGFRSGHNGGLASVMPFDEDAMRLLHLPSTEQLHAVVENASDEEYEFVRRLTHGMVVWVPLLLPMLASEFGEKAAPLAAAAGELFGDLRPDYYSFAVITFLVALRAKKYTAEELLRHTDSLQPEKATLELLTKIPKAEQQAAFNQLPEPDRHQVASELVRRRQRRQQSTVKR